LGSDEDFETVNDLVRARAKTLRALSFETIASLPEVTEEALVFHGNRVVLMVSHDVRGATHLLLLDAYWVDGAFTDPFLARDGFACTRDVRRDLTETERLR
jgi:hypothetical protein